MNQIALRSNGLIKVSKPTILLITSGAGNIDLNLQSAPILIQTKM
jgi:hypothetical protein